MALSLILLAGSASATTAAPQAGKLTLPAVAIAEVPAPALPRVTVEKGATLGQIAATAYGHERFSGFVARLNGVADPEKLQTGTVLNTPSLAVAFRDAGMNPQIQPTLNVLAKACTDFYRVMPGYLKAREASGASTGTFEIPEAIAKAFLECADAIDAASEQWKALEQPKQVPHKTIGQFTQASTLIRELARGVIDGYGYDHDLVGQRLGLGFTYALEWTLAERP